MVTIKKVEQPEIEIADTAERLIELIRDWPEGVVESELETRVQAVLAALIENKVERCATRGFNAVRALDRSRVGGGNYSALEKSVMVAAAIRKG